MSNQRILRDAFAEPRVAPGGAVANINRNTPVQRVERSHNERGRRQENRVNQAEHISQALERQVQRDRHELGASGIHVNPVVETGHVQTRNVRLHLRGIMDVYKGGKVKERTEIDEDEYVVIHFKTMSQLRKAIQLQMGRFLDKTRDLEGDSPNKVFYPTFRSAQDGYSDQEMYKVARRPDQVRMYRAAPIDNRMLKGVSANKLDPEDDDQFNCVVEYLYSTYHSKSLISSLSREAIVELLSDGKIDVDDARERGWTYLDVQRFCDRYRISHYVLDGFKRLVHKKVHKSSNYPALMYVCEDCHMYPLTDPAVRISLQKTYADGHQRHTSVLQLNDEKKREAAQKKMEKLFIDCKWREDVTNLDKLLAYKDSVVFYHKLHLKELLLDLYKYTGTLYEFKHTSKLVTSIQLENNVHLFANANHKANCDWHTSKKVADLLKIPFRNQSLAGLSHEFFVRHYHPKGKAQTRQAISKSKKDKILAEQCNMCNLCGFSVGDKWECDHIAPISGGGDALARSNLQILCSPCHLEKSRKESAESVANIDNSASYYNDQTLKIFGERSMLGVAHNFMKPEEYVRDVKAGRKILAGLDNNKCYTNLLLTSKHEWNCFSVLNDAIPFDKDVHLIDGKLQRGFYYVETKQILIQGNTWLSAPALEYFMQEKLVKREQIKFCVLSSLGLPANYFARFVRGVQEAVEDASLWKRMINSLVGIMGTRKSYNRHFKILLNKQAAANYIQEKRQAGQSITITPHMLEDEENKKHWSDDGSMKKPDYYEVMFNTERSKEESHFPIYAQVIQQGIVELHKAQRLLEKHGGKLVHMKIDQTVALFDNQAQVDAMWAEARQICWDEQGKILKYKRADDIHNTELEMHLHEDAFRCESPEYKVMTDPGHNDFKSIAAELIDFNKSFQLDAVAGCGKTTLLREVIKELGRRNIEWLAMTPTHKSAKVLWRDRVNPKKSAQTIHKQLGRLKYDGCGGFAQFQKYKWIIVDEKSMIKENFLLLLTKIKRYCPDTRFILSGDWKQLPPVMDRSASFNYKESYAIWDLCDGRKLKLKQCRRTDEKHLFHLYTHVEEVNVEEFPHDERKRNICYYNSTRKHLNRYWMVKEAGKHKQRMLLKAHYSVKQSQDIMLYQGLPVIAMTTRGQYGFSNAEEFTVQEFDKSKVTLRFDNDNADDEVEEIKVPTRDFTQFFAPAYAISCHRMQGSSLAEKFTIWNWEQMDQTLKYVALSRSRKLEYINIATDEQLKAMIDENEGQQ